MAPESIRFNRAQVVALFSLAMIEDASARITIVRQDVSDAIVIDIGVFLPRRLKLNKDGGYVEVKA